ncbi:hypothetical protein AVEN_35858-1 [Araneus ventricosus]|uniref:Uncharacterized protein n=1 Tax=Araneus ventricosus TaxID=182803 RepID=A0A4Y2BJA8_ARAVE|nr:hypothetical protein AVEN_35858-1 [Araneus ventricosus]
MQSTDLQPVEDKGRFAEGLPSCSTVRRQQRETASSYLCYLQNLNQLRSRGHSQKVWRFVQQLESSRWKTASSYSCILHNMNQLRTRALRRRSAVLFNS